DSFYSRDDATQSPVPNDPAAASHYVASSNRDSFVHSHRNNVVLRRTNVYCERCFVRLPKENRNSLHGRGFTCRDNIHYTLPSARIPDWVQSSCLYSRANPVLV